MLKRRDEDILFDENINSYANSYSDESNANSKDGLKDRIADGGYEITKINDEVLDSSDTLDITMGKYEIDLVAEMQETMKYYSEETKAAMISDLMEQLEKETDLERAKMLTEYVTCMFGITLEDFNEKEIKVSLHM